MRSQDLRTSGDPLDYSGTLLRIDPDTATAPVSNPLYGDDPADDPIVAYGLRNPYRFTLRPGTSEVCDVEGVVVCAPDLHRALLGCSDGESCQHAGPT